VKLTGVVCLDDVYYGKMALQTRPTHQNKAIGRLRRRVHYSGGAISVWSPWIWRLSGKCRLYSCFISHCGLRIGWSSNVRRLWDCPSRYIKSIQEKDL